MIIPEICPVDDCGLPSYTRKSFGYCNKHWAKYKKYGDATYKKTKPNVAKHELYGTWLGMRQRCLNRSHMHYEHYGGRGVKICKRWLDSFKSFCDDMGDKPSKYHTLDRIDNDGDYTPENCRWATPEVQTTNSRRKFHVNIGIQPQRNGRYRADIGRRGVKHYLGTFDSEAEAIKAREEADAIHGYN